MKCLLALLACLVLGSASIIRPESGPRRQGSGQPKNRIEEEWNSAIPQLSEPKIQERVFKDGSEYRYIYDSQILTGMPHIHYQFSGARIRAIVKIQLGPKDVMQIEKVFVGTLHERFVSEPRGLVELSAFEPISEQDAPFEEVLKKPVQFSYENGKVDDMQVMEDDPYWSINIKRAILAQFQLSINPSEREEPVDETRRRILREGQLDMDTMNEIAGRKSGGAQKNRSPSPDTDDSEYFTVMEDGIAGRCEVSYLVMKMPFDEEKLYPIDADEQIQSSQSQQSGPGKSPRKARAVGPTTPGDDNVLNVTKVFDYRNCEFRPYVFQGLHMTSVCPACDSDPEILFNLLESAAHTRYNITGTKEAFIIDAAITEAVYKVTPRSHYAGSMVAYANVTLVLIESGPIRGPVQFPDQQASIEIDGLHMIRPKFSERRGNQIFYETPEANKPMPQKFEYWPSVENKPQRVKALFEKMVQGMENKEVETEVADLVIYITRLLEYAFTSELEQIHQAIKSVNVPGVQKEEIEHLFADLLVTTGTNCTFTYLKTLIESKQLQGPVVRDVLALLPFKLNIDKISPTTLEEWLDLCQDEAIESDIFAKRACWLSYGTLVHKACAHDANDERVQWKKVQENMKNEEGKSGRSRGPRAVPNKGKNGDDDEENMRCPEDLRKRIVERSVEVLKTADSDEQKILVLKTLANMGLNETIDELAQVISDEASTPMYIRTQAIWALKHIAPEHPVPVLQILLPVYRDTSNPTQIRLAAFVTLLTAQPELVVIQDVAQSLNREPDVHVASYVYSMLTEVANSTDPCLKNLTRDIQLALEFTDPINTDYRFSRVSHGGKYIRQMKRGLFWENHLIMDTEAPVPRAAKFRLHANVMMKSFDLIEFGYDTEGLGETLRKYAGNLTREAFEDAVNMRTPRHPRQAEQTPVPEIDQIASLLNIQPPKPKELRGTAYLKLFGQNTRFLVINPQTVSRLLVETITGAGQNLMPQLTGAGLPMDQRRASTLLDVKMELPTVLGLPIKSGLEMPVVGVFKGKLKVNMEPKPEGGFSGLKTIPQKLMIESDVKTTVVAEIHTKLNVYLGFAKVGTGVRTKMSFVAPISGKMEFSLKDKMTKLSMNMPENPTKLIKVETYPLTYVKWYSRKTQSFQSNKMSFPQPTTRYSMSESSSGSSEEQNEMHRSAPHRPTGPHTAGESLVFLNVTDVPTEMITKTGHVQFPMFNGLPIPAIDMMEIPTPTFVKSRKTHIQLGHETLAAKVDIKAQCEYPDTEIPNVLLPLVGAKAQMEMKLTPKQGGKKVILTVFQRSEMGEKSEKDIVTKLKDKMPDLTVKDLAPSGSQPAPEKIGRVGHSLQILLNSEGNDAPDAWTSRALLAVVYSADGRFTKFVAGVNSKVPALPKKICLVGEMKMPDRNGMWFITPQQPLNKSIQTNMDISWGDECGGEKTIKLRARIQKSKEQMMVEKEDLYDINGIPVPLAVANEVRQQQGEGLFESLFEKCQQDRQRGAFYSQECVDFVTRYTDLLRVKFDIEYKNVSRPIRGLLHKIERWVKHKYYWNVETFDVDVRNPESRVSGLIDFSADRSYLDIKYQTPRTNVSMLKLDLPLDVKPLSVMIPWSWPRIYGLASPVACTLTGPKIHTFDGISDDLPLSQCWHVMAKDKTEENLFAVLVAAAGKNSLAKKLAIVFPGHRLEILPTGPVQSGPSTPASIKNYHIKWDGQEVKDVAHPNKWTPVPPTTPEDKRPLAWIHTEQPESSGNKEPIFEIMSSVTGLRVKFDGTSVTVMPSPLWKSALTGVCGTYNGQPWDDKLLPNKTLVEEPTAVSQAFLLKTGNCDSELPQVNDNTMTRPRMA